jgi:hypothetical protein
MQGRLCNTVGLFVAHCRQAAGLFDPEVETAKNFAPVDFYLRKDSVPPGIRYIKQKT